MKRTGLSAKRELNAELNLTPFIDLLSTCVCFLLLSAVWIEVGSIEIKQSHGTKAAEEQKETFDLEVFFSGSTAAKLYLKKSGKIVKTYKVEGKEGFEEFLVNMDKAIVSEVQMFNKGPTTIATATISTSEGLNYGHLISALDVLRKNKITNIGVMSARNQ